MASESPRFSRIDLLLLVALVAGGAGASWIGQKRVLPSILEWSTYNYWYEGDSPLIYTNMVQRDSDHGNCRRHPIFVLLSHGATCAVTGVAQVPPVKAVRILVATVAGCWVGMLFLLLRGLSVRTWDALIFTLLGATSAAAIFWNTLPETFAPGSVAIMAAVTQFWKDMDARYTKIEDDPERWVIYRLE